MKRGKQRQEAGYRRLAYSVSNRLYADCISVDRFAICRNEGQDCSADGTRHVTVAIAHAL